MSFLPNSYYMDCLGIGEEFSTSTCDEIDFPVSVSNSELFQGIDPLLSTSTDPDSDSLDDTLKKSGSFVLDGLTMTETSSESNSQVSREGSNTILNEFASYAIKAGQEQVNTDQDFDSTGFDTIEETPLPSESLITSSMSEINHTTSDASGRNLRQNQAPTRVFPSPRNDKAQLYQLPDVRQYQHGEDGLNQIRHRSAMPPTYNPERKCYETLKPMQTHWTPSQPYRYEHRGIEDGCINRNNGAFAGHSGAMGQAFLSSPSGSSQERPAQQFQYSYCSNQPGHRVADTYYQPKTQHSRINQPPCPYWRPAAVDRFPNHLSGTNRPRSYCSYATQQRDQQSAMFRGQDQLLNAMPQESPRPIPYQVRPPSLVNNHESFAPQPQSRQSFPGGVACVLKPRPKPMVSPAMQTYPNHLKRSLSPTHVAIEYKPTTPQLPQLITPQDIKSTKRNYENRPKHFDLESLEVGSFNFSMSEDEKRRLPVAKLKVIFTKRRLIYEFPFPVNESGKSPPTRCCVILVPFCCITTIYQHQKNVYLTVNKEPIMCGTEVGQLAGLSNRITFDESLKVDPSNGEFKKNDLHKLTLRGTQATKFVTCLQDFDKRFDALIMNRLFKPEPLLQPLLPCDPSATDEMHIPSPRKVESVDGTASSGNGDEDKLTIDLNPSSVVTSASHNSQDSPATCSCRMSCSTSRCTCYRVAQSCSWTKNASCKCTECNNQLNALEVLGIKSAEAMQDNCLAKYVNANSARHLQDTLTNKVRLPCCVSDVDIFKIVPGIIKCKQIGCNGLFRFSWCRGQVIDLKNSHVLHCPSCQVCCVFDNAGCTQCAFNS